MRGGNSLQFKCKSLRFNCNLLLVSKDPLPRTELTKKLWEYIHKHELQDPKEKRNIRADENLLAVFDGKKVVSMFEMTKYNYSEIR